MQVQFFIPNSLKENTDLSLCVFTEYRTGFTESFPKGGGKGRQNLE